MLKIKFKKYYFFNKKTGGFDKIERGNLTLGKMRIQLPPHKTPTFSNKSQEFVVEPNYFVGNPCDSEGNELIFTHKIMDKNLSGQQQREFYVSFSWIQIQLLAFMQGKHWLNKSENIKWLIGNIINIALAIAGLKLSWAIAHLKVCSHLFIK